MSIEKSRLSRRTLLRGAGVSLALPWLESVAPKAIAATATAAPQRMAFIFVPNGVHLPTWMAEPIRALLDTYLAEGWQARLVGADGVVTEVGAKVSPGEILVEIAEAAGAETGEEGSP